MKHQILFAAAMLAALSGCASSEVFGKYPGALNVGKPISVHPHILEGASPFCVWGLTVTVDALPHAVKPVPADQTHCTSALSRTGKFVSSSPGSFYPLLDFKRVTVSFSRTKGGRVETHVLDISGKMLAAPPPEGAVVAGLFVTTSETKVEVSRLDNGPRHFKKTVIAVSEEPSK